MDVLEFIEDQLIANRLPLVAVTFAALPHGNTPVILALHWHAFVEVPLADGTEPVAFEAVPSSVLQVNARWDGCAELDNAILEAAWELGAWNLERTQAAPFRRPGADTTETTAAHQAFGKAGLMLNSQPAFVADAPDADDLIETAARSGYIHWLFRPVRGGLWAAPSDDITLEKGGYRNPACPLVSKPIVEPQQLRKRLREVYALGQSISLTH